MSTPGIRGLPALTPTWEREADVVVVGAGAAGLSAALAAATGGRKVLLLCKGLLGTGATALAQGGLAAVLDPHDTLDLHATDTLVAGAGLGDPGKVRDLVSAAPGEIARMRGLGANLDADARSAHGLALAREGGHSHARVIHAGGDASGAEVDRTLVKAVLASGADVLECVIALDALTDTSGRVVGLSVARVDPTGRLTPGVVHTPAVVLATGGLGQAWATTTNPSGATGDGIGLALRAGAELRSIEFVQFHPTVLWSGAGARGRQTLVSEAVRGEGAVLVDASGRRVMAGVHPLGDLAPRDVVAVAMHRRMCDAAQGETTHLYLDATGLGRDLLAHRFPSMLTACRAVGIDPVTEPVPVSPGAHYACGGITADLFGRTSVAGLFAVGEVASTGLHGANRLASNSLTEALVAGRRAGELLSAHLPAGGGTPVSTPTRAAVPVASRAATALVTSRDAGVLRDAEGLERLLDHLAGVPDAATDQLTLPMVEATALHTVSTLVGVAALTRRESRGCHRRADIPEQSSRWRQHVTLRLEGDRLRVRTPMHESAA